MEVPGVCAICGAHGIVKGCVICGRTVCRRHHDAATGACVEHAGRRGPAKAPSEGPPDVPEPPEDAGGHLT